MDPKSALLIQQQIKENAEDLQKEFIDLGSWEEEMKKKDLEIRSLKADEALPAVRSKIKKKSVPSPAASKVEKPKKQKRIGVSDYDAWNKFDVDKACKEIDDGNAGKDTGKSVYEVPTEEELEKEHEQAMKLKAEGNVLVKRQEYAKAISKYSEAIKVFPHDAVFYCNRALCQLKINNLYSAEADCTAAIQLDELYVKAYHRRASARIELKRYKDAQNDLTIVLQLDPCNKEAASMLENVKKKVEQSTKMMVISGEKGTEESCIEKAIGKKLMGKSANKDRVNDNKEESESKNHVVIKENSEKSQKSDAAASDVERSAGQESPFWFPKCKKGISFVEPLATAPRRSNQKQTLKRIKVTEVAANESIFKAIEERSEEGGCAESSVQDKAVTGKAEPLSRDRADGSATIGSFPPPARSSVEFITNWRKNPSADFRHKFLKQINPKELPNIFKESLESNLLSEILSILNTEFLRNNDNVYDVLFHLAKVKRFRALILFMTRNDKEVLGSLFEYCSAKESKTEEEVSSLRSVFEM